MHKKRDVRFFALALISIVSIHCIEGVAGRAPGNNCNEQNEVPGFYVEGRHIYDRCGEKVIFRGVNRMTVINDISGLPSFSEIEKTGVNAVRIMWMTLAGSSSGGRCRCKCD